MSDKPAAMTQSVSGTASASIEPAPLPSPIAPLNPVESVIEEVEETVDKEGPGLLSRLEALESFVSDVSDFLNHHFPGTAPKL